MATKEKIKKILDYYARNEKLLPFTNSLERRIKNLKDKAIDKLVQEDLVEAYWRDIGGEGA